MKGTFIRKIMNNTKIYSDNIKLKNRKKKKFRCEKFEI